MKLDIDKIRMVFSEYGFGKVTDKVWAKRINSLDLTKSKGNEFVGETIHIDDGSPPPRPNMRTFKEIRKGDNVEVIETTKVEDNRPEPTEIRRGDIIIIGLNYSRGGIRKIEARAYRYDNIKVYKYELIEICRCHGEMWWKTMREVLPDYLNK